MSAGTKYRVDLNSANERNLSRLPLMDRDIAEEIIHRRPFKSWEDFKQAFGLDQDVIRLLRKGGATLNVADSAEASILKSEQKRSGKKLPGSKRSKLGMMMKPH